MKIRTKEYPQADAHGVAKRIQTSPDDDDGCVDRYVGIIP
jgi:hypothetical protein